MLVFVFYCYQKLDDFLETVMEREIAVDGTLATEQSKVRIKAQLEIDDDITWYTFLLRNTSLKNMGLEMLKTYEAFKKHYQA